MKATTIKAIFTNLLFVVGVILMVIGFVNGTSVLVKSMLFEKYPLNGYDETRCDFPVAMPLERSEGQTSDEDRELAKLNCLDNLEQSRKIKQVEDITFAISSFTAGAVLALIFKRFIFAKEK